MDPIDRRLMLGAAGLAGVAALSKLGSIAQAGPLNPPAGPIAPTGKTTAEVFDRIAAAESLLSTRIARTPAGVAEPRVPVQSLPGTATAQYLITQPGSYYLADNIQGVSNKHGILVSARDVSIDLCGHRMVGPTSGSLTAIRTTVGQLSVRNGRMTDWSGAIVCEDPLESGFDITGLHAVRCGSAFVLGQLSTVVDVVVDNGVVGGIDVGAFSHVLRTIVRFVNGFGFAARGSVTFNGCSALSNLGDGFRCVGPSTLSSCVSSFNRGYGFTGAYSDELSNAVLVDCSSDQDWDGFHVSNSELDLCRATGAGLGASGRGTGFSLNFSRAYRCSAYNCRRAGFRLFQGARAEGCDASYCSTEASGQANFFVDIFAGASEQCAVTSCVSRVGHTGFRVLSARNLVTGCRSIAASSTAFDIAPGNAHGPIVNVAGVGDITSVPNANHPWANFVY